MTQERLHGLFGRVKALVLGLALAAVMSSRPMLVAEPAHAAGQTFTVNNTGDPVEGDPEFGVCNVNFCTLRTFQAQRTVRKSAEPLEGVATSPNGYLSDKDSGGMFYVIHLA
jgi:hypothetical protein